MMIIYVEVTQHKRRYDDTSLDKSVYNIVYEYVRYYWQYGTLDFGLNSLRLVRSICQKGRVCVLRIINSTSLHNV